MPLGLFWSDVRRLSTSGHTIAFTRSNTSIVKLGQAHKSTRMLLASLLLLLFLFVHRISLLEERVLVPASLLLLQLSVGGPVRLDVRHLCSSVADKLICETARCLSERELTYPLSADKLPCTRFACFAPSALFFVAGPPNSLLAILPDRSSACALISLPSSASVSLANRTEPSSSICSFLFGYTRSGCFSMPSR